MRVAASSLWVLVCVRAGTLLCVAAVCAVCCVAVFVECAATDWGGDTVLATVSVSCPLTGLLWSHARVRACAPVVRIEGGVSGHARARARLRSDGAVACEPTVRVEGGAT